MAVEFYNPGSRITEKVPYDHPTNDPKKMNTISFYDLLAPEKSWFEVPTEHSVETNTGTLSVSVRFADKIQKDYRAFGVIRLEPGRDVEKRPYGEDDNVAVTKKEAEQKGNRLWRECMLSLVREHKRICDEVRHAGLLPARARGNVAHALRTLGIEDPANDVADVLQRKEDLSEMDRLKAQIDEMQKLMLNLAAKK